VLAHLSAENAYREALSRRLQPLVDRLYDEIVGRIQQDDDSVPYVYRGFRYWRRYATGREYPVYLRCSDTPALARKCCSISTSSLPARSTTTSASSKSADNRWLATPRIRWVVASTRCVSRT
jgi:protease II